MSFQVLGRCFLTVMQVHFQFLSQALQKVQPVAQSCLAEALAQAQERCANSRSQSSDLGPLTELEEASRSWKGAAQVCSNIPPGLFLVWALEIWGLSWLGEKPTCCTFLRNTIYHQFMIYSRFLFFGMHLQYYVLYPFIHQAM